MRRRGASSISAQAGASTIDALAAMTDAAAGWTALDRDGFAVVRGAVPGEWIAPLRATFERGFVPSDRWPAMRGRDWRHAMVDTDPLVLELCRLPQLIDAVRHMLRAPFFLVQVEGRDPCRGNAAQLLHRDGAGMGGQIAAAMIWLDPYDADNGATRIVPRSHLDVTDAGNAAADHAAEEGEAVVLSGEAGDILLFAPDVLHGATVNRSGAPRRSLLLTYAVAGLREQFAATAALRGVRLGYDEIFA